MLTQPVSPTHQCFLKLLSGDLELCESAHVLEDMQFVGGIHIKCVVIVKQDIKISTKLLVFLVLSDFVSSDIIAYPGSCSHIALWNYVVLYISSLQLLKHFITVSISPKQVLRCLNI